MKKSRLFHDPTTTPVFISTFIDGNPGPIFAIFLPVWRDKKQRTISTRKVLATVRHHASSRRNCPELSHYRVQLVPRREAENWPILSAIVSSHWSTFDAVRLPTQS